MAQEIKKIRFSGVDHPIYDEGAIRSTAAHDAAVNSGINGTLVGQITTNKNDISNRIKYDDVLMPANNFGGKRLYINTINNAFIEADQRFKVTVTLHSLTKSQSGVSGTFPRIRSGRSVTDDDYFEDGQLIDLKPASVAAALFDGSYEFAAASEPGMYLKIRIMFGDNTSPSASTSYFPDYPYGDYYLSYQWTNVPGKLSEYRVYNKYAESGQSLGWDHKTAEVYTSETEPFGTYNYIEKINDEGHYQRSCVEFIIYPKSSTESSYLTEIDYKLIRPNRTTASPYLYKVYPIGSIYISTNSKDPAQIFGGTWEAIHGRFLLAEGQSSANSTDWWGQVGNFTTSPNETGGEAFHTLTIDEMPSHNHALNGWIVGWGQNPSGDPSRGRVDLSGPRNGWAGYTISNTGGGQSHKNMPPYMSVYMWKRLA